MPKEKSIVRNALFNILKTISGIAFPIITFSYSARILGENGIGKVNFARNIVTYFIMIALLGMNEYGTRECAKLRHDRDGLSKFTHEMLLINFFTTLLSYALFFSVLFTVPKLQPYKSLLLLSSLAIFLKGMGVEWLYQGLEEYQYIAVRSALFQAIALIILLAFVRDADDVMEYAFVILLATSGSYIFNFINMKKMVAFRRYDHYEIRKHLRPLLWLFAMAVSIELYTVLDSTMLGFLQGDAAVGRYTAAVKVNKLVVTLITSIGTVMTPRLAYYIEHGEKEKVNLLVDRVYNYVLLFSVPAAIGLCMIGQGVILLFSGTGFSSAIITMRILTPIIFITPLSIVTNAQTFVPMGKEKLILLSTMTGAVVNFTCNLILIPHFAENGAAVATVIAETMVTIVCLTLVRRFFNLRKILSSCYQYFVAAIPIPIIAVLIERLNTHYTIKMGIVIVLSAVCYCAILAFFRNRYFKEAICFICKKKVP